MQPTLPTWTVITLPTQTPTGLTFTLPSATETYSVGNKLGRGEFFAARQSDFSQSSPVQSVSLVQSSYLVHSKSRSPLGMGYVNEAIHTARLT